MKRLWEKTPWQVVLAAFAVPFLLRNLLLPMVGDDYSYAFIWDGEDLGNLMDNIGPRERISSLQDIIVSQWSHYFTWGGRTISMFFIQLFAWVGKIWFDIANTIVFTLLMLVLYWLAVGRIEPPSLHKGTFLWLMLCMLFGVIDYPSTMLWMTGACVYHWTGLWESLFLLVLLRGKKTNCFLIAILGLCAGWSEEAGSLVTVMLTTVFLYSVWRRKQLQWWMIIGFVFLLIGCSLLMLAPGSLHREQLMLEYAPEYVLPAEELFSAKMFYDNFTEGFLPIFICESFLFLPILFYFKRGGRSKRILAFTAGGMIVLVIMMFAPEFALRTGFHSTMFLAIASTAAFKEVAPWIEKALCATPLSRVAAFVAGTLCVFYGLFVMAGAFYVESSYRQQFDNRLAYVTQHQDQQQLVVPAYKIPYNLDHWLGPRSLMDEHLIYAADLETKPTDNRSLMYALYFGLPPTRIDREVDWKKRHGE